MEKTAEKQLSRTAFIRQPARVLLVDCSPPFDADTCEYLHDALVDFFSIVTHLSGPCRTPFFGLFVLKNQPENLFSLQHVRGNFSRLHSAFEELKFFGKENSTSPCTPDTILQGLKEAAAQFKRQSQSLRQMSTSSCQLEIVFLTCRVPTSVTKLIEKSTKSFDLERLKKIQVVNVQSSDVLNIEEDDTRSEDSSPGTDDDGLVGCGLVDVVSLEKDILSFQNFFKTWLLDGGTDQEHLRLTLPSAFTQDSESDQSQDTVNTGLTLKCDLHECLLDPFHLPYQSHFTVYSESANLTSKGRFAATKPNVLTYPVYNLTAVKLVKTEAVCESVLFGMPYIVRPTMCWKLDWEDLESNQQHFHALCSVLNERGVSLLTKTDSGDTETSPVRRGTVAPSPHGHFLFLPSDNNCLLLKSIAVSELMLPRDVPHPMEGLNDDVLSAVTSCLDQMELSNTYNPLFVHSNLYKSLFSQSLKSSSQSKPLKRRCQAPEKTQLAKQVTSRGQASTNQQPKRLAARAQVRPVVFTNAKDTTSQASQVNEFMSAASVFSTSKRFRQNSAANVYNNSTPSFPDDL